MCFISEQRNPLLFGIAAHHISSAINSTKEGSQNYTGSSETCERLASAVERLPNQVKNALYDCSIAIVL